MKEKLRFLGMDVHAETIAAAIAEPDGEVRSLGTIPNRMESVRKLLKKLVQWRSCGFVMKRGRPARVPVHILPWCRILHLDNPHHP
jgi:hypothetical protein